MAKKHEPREHVIDAELANGNRDAWRQVLGFPEIVMQPRNGVAELIQAHLRGEIPYDGPDSLISKVHALGYKTTSLYEMVIAAERANG